MGRPLGWAGTLSLGGRGWASPGLWFLLGLGVCDGSVEGEYSTFVLLWSRGWCHFWVTWLDAAEADGEFSRRSGQFANRPYRGKGVPARRGCAFRRDGFLPPQERRWGVTVWGGPARPFDPPDRTYSKLRVSGPSRRMDSGSGGRNDGGGRGGGAVAGCEDACRVQCG